MKFNKFVFKLLATVLVLFSNAVVAAGSAPAVEFVKTYGSQNGEWVTESAMDNAGNLYTVGYFSGLAGSVTSIDGISAVNKGYKDVLVAKYDNAGNAIWVRTFGSAGNFNEEGSHIVVDGQGNVYISGIFSSTSFQAGGYTKASQGGNDAFIIKLDSAGTFKWIQTIGNYGNEIAPDLMIDRDGHLVISGVFGYTSVNVGGKVLTHLSAATGYVAKLYTSNGLAIWAKTFGGTGYIGEPRLARDANNTYYLAGTATKAVSFDAHATFTASNNVFVAKLNANGHFSWVNRYISSGANYVRDVTTDSFGEVVLTGYFNSSYINYNGLGAVYSHGGSGDGFVSKLDSAGNIQWLKALGGNGLDVLTGVVTDSSGNIYFSGYFNSSQFIVNGMIETKSGASYTAISGKLDSNGSPIWLKDYGSTNYTYGFGIEERNGNAYLFGHFSKTLSVDGTYIPNASTGYSTYDMYIIKTLP